MSDAFIPFVGRLKFKGGDLMAHPTFVVASMFTPSYRDFAVRLAISLEQLGLPFVIYEVPVVHCSISPRGSDDLACTKANFLNFVLDKYRTPILYVDCDCVFRDVPKRIMALVADGCDFAIYNWFADEHTDAFVPCSIPEFAVPGGSAQHRFYKFSHSNDLFMPDQLLCSGAVQLYSTSAAALDLLVAWSNAIRDFPRVADDECLGYAFNFRRSTTLRARSSWLDKSYARYLVWIYARPIIDHPQVSQDWNSAVQKIESAIGMSPWKTDHAEIRVDGRLFPRDALIDVVQRRILRPRDTGRTDGRMEYVPYAPLHIELFLS